MASTHESDADENELDTRIRLGILSESESESESDREESVREKKRNVYVKTLEPVMEEECDTRPMMLRRWTRRGSV